jgi:hypothetical protein
MAFIIYSCASCASFDDIQVQRRFAILVKKEIHQRGDASVVFQYWQDTEFKDVQYFEELKPGDTGFMVGMKAPLLIRK